MENLNTTQLRLAVLIFTIYFGVMRAEEASNLLMENVSISNSGNLRITLLKGKMNQFKKRQEVLLVPTVRVQALCPVRIILKWYNHLLDLGGSKFLFPNLRGDRTIIQGSRISYSNLRKVWNTRRLD